MVPRVRIGTRVVLALVLATPALAATNYSIAYTSQLVNFLPQDGWTLDDSSAGTAYTNVPQANVTVAFNGSQVYLLASMKHDRNQLRIQVDGQDCGAGSEWQPLARGTPPANTIIWTKTDLTPDQPHTLVAWNDPAVGANPKPWAAFTGIIYTTDQTSAPGVALPPGQGGVVAPNVTGSRGNAPAALNRTLIAGIAVGVGVLVVALVGALVFVGMRLRRARRDRDVVLEVQRVQPFEVLEAPVSPLPQPGALPKTTSPSTAHLLGHHSSFRHSAGVDAYGRPLSLAHSPALSTASNSQAPTSPLLERGPSLRPTSTSTYDRRLTTSSTGVWHGDDDSHATQRQDGDQSAMAQIFEEPHVADGQPPPRYVQ